MENEFRIKKNNAKEKVEFHDKEKLTRLRHSWWPKSMEKILTSPRSDSDNDEDELEIL